MVKYLLPLVLFCNPSFGQQNPQYSQYTRNQIMMNPGATGVYDFVDVTLGGRMQWLGFDNAPKTSYLYFAAPVSALKNAKMKRTYGVIRRGNKSVKHPELKIGNGGHAVGGYLMVDQYGPFQQFKGMANYAYHLRVNRKYNVSFGVSAGLSNRSFIPGKAEVLSAMTNTGVVDATYNAYAANQGSQNTMDLESGIYFYGKELFVGVSANQLTNDLVAFGNVDINFDPRRHYYVTAGYKFQATREWTITPSFLVKYVKPAPVSFEVSGVFDYQERFWFGLSYRHQDAIVAMLGATISDRFKCGYSFDFNINRFNTYSAGGHELVLGFMLGR